MTPKIVKDAGHLLFLLIESTQRRRDTLVHWLRGTTCLPLMLLYTDVMMLCGHKVNHLAI